MVRQAVEQHDLIVEQARLMAELQGVEPAAFEANRLKGAFIEVASHELNTPVAVILGMTELWQLTQGEAASPAERGWVERIQVAGKRLAGIVERMLKLVRTEQFGNTLELWATDLGPLIRGVVADLQPVPDGRASSGSSSTSTPSSARPRSTRRRSADILTNLLVNAIKFTPDGGSRSAWSRRPDGPDRVRFQVTDQGVGIDPADRPYLFEPFFTGFDTDAPFLGRLSVLQARDRPGPLPGQGVRRAARRHD